MKVALITNYWKNSDGGGIKTFLVNFVQTLKDVGTDVSVVFRDGYDPEQFNGGRNKIAFSFNCFWYLWKIKPDVIHTQETWYCLLPGVIYKKIFGCKLIHTFHTEPDKSLQLFAKTFFQILLNTCDCVTFVSMRLQERIIEVDRLSFQNTAITYAGVPAITVSDYQVKEFKKQFGISDDSIILAAIGMTALSYKAEGLKVLLRAIQLLKESHPDIVLIVTREGKYSDDVKAFAHEIGLERHVIFTGNIENPFIPLKMSKMYTHITLGDGLPIALLEAMSMGKPIIATPIAGIPEAIESGTNGFLVEPNPEKIAEKIDFLLQNPETCEKISQNAHYTAKNKFSWENATKRFILLYHGECR
ncbi:glycosyltransferase family 4 protein [Methanoregula sp.]|uniref:glycosyltransferase family 4 protein n=1 Tax=Methanoregula sp. TaxID=2052170 RepID=UPI002636F869|nr:glycosyltransferase family 4 protein [Methanoregula sp.]MDD5141900.1 glycosyltransferase family 4 protein [Methanoregula sp.]